MKDTNEDLHKLKETNEDLHRKVQKLDHQNFNFKFLVYFDYNDFTLFIIKNAGICPN